MKSRNKYLSLFRCFNTAIRFSPQRFRSARRQSFCGRLSTDENLCVSADAQTPVQFQMCIIFSLEPLWLYTLHPINKEFNQTRIRICKNSTDFLGFFFSHCSLCSDKEKLVLNAFQFAVFFCNRFILTFIQRFSIVDLPTRKKHFICLHNKDTVFGIVHISRKYNKLLNDYL